MTRRPVDEATSGSREPNRPAAKLDVVKRRAPALAGEDWKGAGITTVEAVVRPGTTMLVKVEQQEGRRRVIEVMEIDTTTALPGQPHPVRRKQKNST